MDVLPFAAAVVAYVAVGLLAARVADWWLADDGESRGPWDPAALSVVVSLWPLALAAAVLIAGAHSAVWLADRAGRVLARVAGLEVRE